MSARLRKIVITTVGILLAVVLLGIALLQYLVDEQRLKAELAEIIHERTGATLHIDGALGVALWPRFGVRAQGVRLVPAGSTVALLEIEKATATLQIRPLLRREILVDGIRVQGVVVLAEIDSEGRASWLNASTPTQSGASGGVDIATAAAAPLAIGVSRIDIDDARIEYWNRQTGQYLRIDEAQLSAADVNLTGELYPLKFSGRLQHGKDQEPARVTVDARLGVDVEHATLTLERIELSWDAPSLPPIVLTSVGQVRWLQRQAEFSDWQIKAPGLAGEGSLAVDWSGELPSFRIPMRFTAIDVSALADASGNSLPEIVNADQLQGLTLAGEISGNGDTLRLDQLALQAGDIHLQGDVAYSGSSSPQLDAKLHINRLDPSLLLLPAAVVGDEAMLGTIPGTAPGAIPEPLQKTAAELPLALLHFVDARITLTAEEARYAPYQASNLVLTLRAQAGVLELQELSAEAYDGLIDLRATLDARQPVASLTSSSTVLGLDIASVLAAGGKPQNVVGRLNASATLNAAGNSTEAWLDTLSGPADFNIAGGEVRDLNVEKMLCEVIASSRQESLSADFEPLTIFQKVTAKLQFEQGIARLQPLSAVLPNLQLGGIGSYHILAGNFDTVLTARLTGDLESRDPACRVDKRLLGIDWPLRCKGRLDDDPARWYGIDRDGVQKILTQLATQEVQQKVEEKLQKKLDKLFGNSKDKNQEP